ALARVRSGGLDGISGLAVDVEVSLTSGLPGVVMLGLPHASVKESRERVKAVIRNVGLAYPRERMTGNTAPGGIKKEGPLYDVPLAIGVLVVSGQIPHRAIDGSAFLGELTLDGTLRPVRGALPIALALRSGGAERIFVPRENADEAACVGGLRVHAVEPLTDLVAPLRREAPIPPPA